MRARMRMRGWSPARKRWAATMMGASTLIGCIAASALGSSGAPLTQQGPKLTGAGEVGAAQVGTSVAVSADGNTALVGGSYDNNQAGAVWVFTRSGSTWTAGPKLTPDDEAGGGTFGVSVSLSADGNTALIGGGYDNGYLGAAWVFTRSGATWTQDGPKLTPSDENGDGLFGDSVSLSADGNTALIGGLDDAGGAGAAWAFTRSGSTWSQEGPKLTADDESGHSNFGYAVGISGDGNTAFIGGPSDNAGAGAAWAFARSGSVWTQQGPKLIPDGAIGSVYFGATLALSADGSTALVSGTEDNNGVGAVWGYARSGSLWAQQGSKLVASDENGDGSFGSGMALSANGNAALIGAFGDNGETVHGLGAAWLFTRSGTAWQQDGSKVTPDDESGGGLFGSSGALSADGSTALIGGHVDGGGLGAAWAFTRVLPTSTDQCKNGGWASYGVFKNQGDCVSYVATAGKNPPGK